MKNFIKGIVLIIVLYVFILSVFYIFPENSGNVADWFSALGTVGAVCFSFYMLFRENREKIIDRDKEILYKVSTEFYNILQIKEDLNKILHNITMDVENGLYEDINEKFNHVDRSINVLDRNIYNSYALLENISKQIDELYKSKKYDIDKLDMYSYYINDENYKKLLIEMNRSFKDLNVKIKNVVINSYYASEETYNEESKDTEYISMYRYSYVIKNDTTFMDIIGYIRSDLIDIQNKIDLLEKNIKTILNK